jgi:hypothetical protein
VGSIEVRPIRSIREKVAAARRPAL